jgi:hypothetical protein
MDEKALKRIKVYGPNRVVINKEGEAYSPNTAEKMDGVTPTIIFVRDDGWSLGAPDKLWWTAMSMWYHHWTHVIVKFSIGKLNRFKVMMIDEFWEEAEKVKGRIPDWYSEVKREKEKEV